MDELYNYIRESGIIVPNTDTVLSDVQTYWRSLFGNQLSIEASTPQGRIIETQAVIRKGTLGVCALVANQLNPNVATGTFLDAHGAFFGLSRTGAKNSIINGVKLTGLPQTGTPKCTITFGANPTSGDNITVMYLVNGDITATKSFTFGTDITIGADADATAANTSSVINSDADLSALLSSTVSGNIITLTAVAAATVVSRNRIYAGSSINDIESTTIDNYCYIPQGSAAITANGETFVLSSGVLLNASGEGYGTFVARDSGEIAVSVGALNVIGTPVDGWETVYNGSIAQIGYEEQPDDLYRQYIQNSKMVNSTSMPASILSELYAINGLQDAKIIENYTSQSQEHDDNPEIPVGEEIPSHSIMVIVHGANAQGNFDTLVAKAILKNRSCGCGMAAVVNTSNVRQVSLSDDGVGQYTMTFNYAEQVPIYTYLEVINNGYSGDINTAIKNVLQNWFAGNSTEISATNFIKIGKNVSAFELAGVIMQNLSVYIPKCYIGTSASPSSSDEIDISNVQIATIEDANITINLLS